MVRAASLVDFDGFINIYTILEERLHVQRLRGATVARLTPDQKVACSNHVGVINIFFLLLRPTGTSGNVFIYQNRAAFGQNSDKVTSRSERLFNPGLGLFTAANIILPCHRKTKPSLSTGASGQKCSFHNDHHRSARRLFIVGRKGAQKSPGPAEIWTRIAGFRVLSANHYTTGPRCRGEVKMAVYLVPFETAKCYT